MGVIAGITTGFTSQSLQYVKSVQQVSIALGNGVTSNTATITSIDTNRSFLVYQGFTCSSAAAATMNIGMPSFVFTNSTTITATRNTSDTGTVTVKVTVIEAYATLVQSVQSGSIAVSANTNNVTNITAVDTNYSVVFYNGMTTTSTANGSQFFTLTLAGPTCVEAQYSGLTTPVTSTIKFMIVTFNPAAIKSIQRFNSAVDISGNVDTQNINTITTANSMIVYSGLSGISTTWDNTEILAIASTTTVTRNQATGANNTARSVSYYIVEFVSGVVKSNQSGTISMTSVTSKTAAVSTVNTNKTILSFVGLNSATGSTAYNSAAQAITLTNATTVTGTINTSEASAKGVGFQAVEFN